MHAYVRRVSTITQRGLADGLRAEHREGNKRISTTNKRVLSDPTHVQVQQEGDAGRLRPRRPLGFTATRLKTHTGAAFPHKEMLLTNRDGHV